MVRIFFIFFYTFTIVRGDCQDHHFTYDARCFDIYQSILELRLDIAGQQVDHGRIQDPGNLAYLHLENYIDFIRLFITEDEDLYKSLRKNKDNRVRSIKNHLHKGSPYYRFALAEINLQWAVTHAKFNHLFTAARDILTAYNYLKENDKSHPDFIYNKKSLSVIHSLIETLTIPGFIKRFLGMKGSVDLGLREIEYVLDNTRSQPYLFKEETQAIYAFILFYQANERERAWKFIRESTLDPTKSGLACFLHTKLAQHSGKNEEALAILDSYKPSADQERFLYLELLKGMCRLSRLDTTSTRYIQTFLTEFKGRHYIKEAYQKLAWAALVFDADTAQYLEYMQRADKYGYDFLDGDKQAQKEADLGIPPHPILLKARLLFDGGYYTKAYRAMIEREPGFENDEDHSIEYYYRLGRITQALKNYPDALKYFGRTINSDNERKLYYPCNAALQMGLIYEEQGDFTSAERYYNICLSLSPDDYKSSLHQKARTGLMRLKKE